MSLCFSVCLSFWTCCQKKPFQYFRTIFSVVRSLPSYSYRPDVRLTLSAYLPVCLYLGLSIRLFVSVSSYVSLYILLLFSMSSVCVSTFRLTWFVTESFSLSVSISLSELLWIAFYLSVSLYMYLVELSLSIALFRRRWQSIFRCQIEITVAETTL